MTLTAQDVAEITRLLEESSFDELHLELDGLKLSLKRRNEAAPRPLDAAAAAPEASVSGRGPEPDEKPPPVEPAESVGAVREVAAPLLGTFYRAPKPGAPSFIEVGSSVQEESVIGIIEVMKLMNTVRAGMTGTVVEILAHDGALVEYGEALLRIREPVRT